MSRPPVLATPGFAKKVGPNLTRHEIGVYRRPEDGGPLAHIGTLVVELRAGTGDEVNVEARYSKA